MPIFIPVLIVAGCVALGGAGVGLVVKAKRRISAAKQRLQGAVTEYERAQEEYTRKGKETERAFAALGEAKLHAIKTLGEVARLLRNARVRERGASPSAQIEVPQLDRWECASVNAVHVLSSVGSGGLIGVSTAAGVYGLVGILGTASTGTAISTLTGIAASNATLAWLGGGALAVGGGGVALGTCVLGGAIAGPLVLVTGIGLNASAARFETKVEHLISEINIAKEEMRTRGVLLDQVAKRADELMTSISKTEEAALSLMQVAQNGDLKAAYDLFKAAKALSELIDTPLMDKDGRPVL